MRILLLAILAVCVFVVGLPTFSCGSFVSFPVFWANQFELLLSRGYIIPAESSVCSFRVVVDNEGSGEFWLYGADEVNVYAQGEGTPRSTYFKMRISEGNACPQFSMHDHRTWCAKQEVPLADPGVQKDYFN